MAIVKRAGEEQDFGSFNEDPIIVVAHFTGTVDLLVLSLVYHVVDYGGGAVFPRQGGPPTLSGRDFEGTHSGLGEAAEVSEQWYLTNVVDQGAHQISIPNQIVGAGGNGANISITISYYDSTPFPPFYPFGHPIIFKNNFYSAITTPLGTDTRIGLTENQLANSGVMDGDLIIDTLHTAVDTHSPLDTVNTWLIIENSGNMSGAELTLVKNASIVFMNNYLTPAADNRLGIITFESTAFQRTIMSDYAAIGFVESAINSITTTAGSSRMDLALERVISQDFDWGYACKEARNIIIIAAGQVDQVGTTINTANELRTNFFSWAGNGLAKHYQDIYTVGLGVGAGAENTLKSVQNDGYYYSSNGSDLNAIFNDILSKITNTTQNTANLLFKNNAPLGTQGIQYIISEWGGSVAPYSRNNNGLVYTQCVGGSAVWMATQFRESTEPPSVVLNTPDGTNFGDNNIPALLFTGFDIDTYELTYRIQIDVSDGFGSPIVDVFSEVAPGFIDVTEGTTDPFKQENQIEYTVQTPLAEGTWHWRVRAFDGLSWSWSDPKHFIIDANIAPEIVLNTLDETNFGQDNTPSLYFIGTDGNGDALNYHIQIDTIPSFHSLGNAPVINKFSYTDVGFIENHGGPPQESPAADPFPENIEMLFTVQAGNELDPGLWYWRVKVRDPEGTNTWATSETRTFIIEVPNTPPTVVLHTPDGFDFGLDNTPELSFTGTDPDNDDITYQLQSDDHVHFTSKEIDTLSAEDVGFIEDHGGPPQTSPLADPFPSGIAMLFIVPGVDALPPGFRYWRVRAKDPLPEGTGGWGGWATGNFYIGDPNVTPTIVLDTLDEHDFGSDDTPQLLFTGTDADIDDITYEIKINDVTMLGYARQEVISSYGTGNGSNYIVLGPNVTSIAQSFKGDGNRLDIAKFYFLRVGVLSGNINCTIYAHAGAYGISSKPTGIPLYTSDSIDVSTISTSLEWHIFNFPDRPLLTDERSYVLSLNYIGGSGSNPALYVRVDDSSPTHEGNASEFNGFFWVPVSEEDYIHSFSSSLLIEAASTEGEPPFGGTGTDPYASGNQISYTVEAADSLPTGTYYWTVRVKDPDGRGVWSNWADEKTFIISGNLPTIVIDTIDGTIFTTGNPQIDFTGFDVDLDELTYEFEFEDDILLGSPTIRLSNNDELAEFINKSTPSDPDPFPQAVQIGFTFKGVDTLTNGTWYYRARCNDLVTGYSDWEYGYFEIDITVIPPGDFLSWDGIDLEGAEAVNGIQTGKRLGEIDGIEA